jgi:hypothetical protein
MHSNTCPCQTTESRDLLPVEVTALLDESGVLPAQPTSQPGTPAGMHGLSFHSKDSPFPVSIVNR